MPKPAAADLIFTVQCRDRLVEGLCDRREGGPIYQTPELPSPYFARCLQAKRLPSLEPGSGEAANPKARQVIRGRVTEHLPAAPGSRRCLPALLLENAGPGTHRWERRAPDRGAAIEGRCVGDKDRKTTAPSEAPPLAWGGVS